MKENILSTLAIIFAIGAFIILCSLSYYLLLVRKDAYYSVIDNTRYKLTEDNKYSYNLTSYNEHGKKKEIKFATTRELKEDAYIKLDVMFIRGVVSWEEVAYEEIPPSAQSRIPNYKSE